MSIDAPDVRRDAYPTGALLPGDPGYEEACISFNGMIDRKPAVVVQPTTTAEVAAAVRAARRTGLPIAIRGGGHSVSGHAIADGAMVVDLRRMREVEVDPARRLARAQGGALWEDVDGATVPHSLYVPGGTFVDTGIGGLTLSGGIGFLMGTGGLTCDNLIKATVVTADASIVIAGLDGDERDSDLLWALRGGGGNFGVVTEFVFSLNPLGEIHIGAYAVPLRDAAIGLEAVAEIVRTGPPELAFTVAGPTTEQRSVDGAEARPREFVRLFGVYHGPRAGAEAAMAPLRRLPDLRGDIVPMTYPELQAISGILTFGLRNYWKGHFLRDMEPAAIEAVVAALESAQGNDFLLLEAIVGRGRSEPEGGAAFGQRVARWNASALGIWEDPREDEEHMAWVRRFTDRVAPASLSGAGYGNYAPVDETADRVRASFGPERWDRLVAIKRRYDPENVFRFNHNIDPGQVNAGQLRGERGD